MFKLNIEIHPFATKGLAPRYNISQSRFRKIRIDKMDKFNGRCEACSQTDIKMELHESATIRNRTYVFNGFILLCRKCHDIVHCIKSTNRLETMGSNVDWIYIRHDIEGRSRFNIRSEFSRHIQKAFDLVIDFTMADQVSCDYSAVIDYGLNPNELKDGFEKNYDHFASRIRYMADYLDWFFENEKMRMANPEVYVLHPDSKRLKKFKAIHHAEYLRHKDYYTINKEILFGKVSPEREKLIFDYAQVMKEKSTASKYKPKTKSK